MKLRQKEGWYRDRFPGEYSIQDAFEIEVGGSAGGTDTIVAMVLQILHDKGALSNEEVLSMLNSHNVSWEEAPEAMSMKVFEETEAPHSGLPTWLMNKVPGSDE